MKKRHEYMIYSDKIIIKEKTYAYTYSNSIVEMGINRDGYCIKVSRPSLLTFETILKDRLFQDAIKKAELLFLIDYGRKIKINKLFCCIDGYSEVIFESSKDKENLVFGIVDNELISEFNHKWKTLSVKETILNVTKSNYDRRFAAMFALITAKSKKTETEKFIFLWMSMNAYYGYIADYAKEVSNSKNNKEWIRQENAKIKFLSLLMGYEYDSSKYQDGKKEKELIINIEKICENINDIDCFINDCKNNCGTNDYLSKINECLLNTDECLVMHPYMFFLLWFPYKIRCKYFHGEKPIKLLGFVNEQPLPTLRVLNGFLLDFLDNALVDLFVEKKMLQCKETIKEIIFACICEKGHLIEYIKK